METGELSVIGNDFIELQLQGRPDRTRVHFAGEQVIAPCSPHHFDSLDSFVIQKGNQFYLVIKWQVSNTRDIKWEADY
jgi:hypothetical protein